MAIDDASRLGLIWKREIMPYLEDHFFDEPGRLAEFALEKLKAKPAPVGVPAGGGVPGQDLDAAAAE